MPKTGKPWISQYPRRKDGGWENTDLRNMLRAAKMACDRAEFISFDVLRIGKVQMFTEIQDAMSKLQEAADMFAEMYIIDRDEEKAAFIKINADQFKNPDVFLEPEQTAEEFINSACAEFAEQKKTSQS